MPLQSSEMFDIVIVGAGNVAFGLTRSFVEAGHRIIQIASITADDAMSLSKIANCDFTVSLKNVKRDAEIYILAVPDAAISKVIKELPAVEGIVVHTSGSTPLGVHTDFFSNYGVFYPFQTFSKNRHIKLFDVPFCIEGSSKEVSRKLFSLAISIGAKPIEMDFETRKWLHISGVFSCNFVNHMLAIGQQIAEEKGFDFSLLKPLVFETIQKAMEGDPVASQTGPAIRGDHDTIKKHAALLGTVSEELRELYLSLSSSIWQLQRGDE